AWTAPVASRTLRRRALTGPGPGAAVLAHWERLKQDPSQRAVQAQSCPAQWHPDSEGFDPSRFRDRLFPADTPCFVTGQPAVPPGPVSCRERSANARGPPPASSLQQLGLSSGVRIG